MKPGDKFPLTKFKILDGKQLELSEALENHTLLLLVVYRGKQCSYCKQQLSEIEERYDEISKPGVNVLAVSADSAERAQQTLQDLALSKIQLAYDLDIEEARKCGLFISRKRKEVEMPLFVEPGIFLIRPDQRVEAAWISSFAFPRPPLTGIIAAINFVLDVDPALPPRGSA